jgi:hypothetical protein
MTTVRNIERRIERVEHFRVAVKHLTGKDVRGDRSLRRQYPYRQGAAGRLTVAGWKRLRFEPVFPGFDVDVLDTRRRPVNGNTLIATIRAEYEHRDGA